MLPGAESQTEPTAYPTPDAYAKITAARLRPLEHPALRNVGDADAVAARDAGQRGQQALQPVPVADLAHHARVLAQRGRVQAHPARACRSALHQRFHRGSATLLKDAIADFSYNVLVTARERVPQTRATSAGLHATRNSRSRVCSTHADGAHADPTPCRVALPAAPPDMRPRPSPPHLPAGRPRYLSDSRPPAVVPYGSRRMPRSAQNAAMPFSARRSSSEYCTCAPAREALPMI